MLQKYTLVLFCLVAITSFSQNKKIDSLKMVLNTTKLDTVKVETLSAVAGQFWNSNWDSARYYSKKSYELAIKIKDIRGVIMNLINLATYEEINGDFKKSSEFYFKAFTLLKKNKDNRLLASYYYNFGNLKYSEGNTDEALKNYYLAINYFKKFNKIETIAKINDNIALIYTNQSDYKKSIETYLSSIKIYTAKNNYKQLCEVYVGIGLNYSYLKENNKAFIYYKKGLEIAKKYNLIDNEANCYFNMGCTYGELKQNNLAEKYFILAKEKFLKSGSLGSLISCDINYCELLLRTNKVGEATKIINSIDFTKIQTARDYINANKIKGKCLLKENKDAIKYFEEAYNVTLQTKLNKQLPEILGLLLEANFKNKNDTKNLKYLKEYDSISKLQNQIENKGYFFNLETKYQTAEKESKIKTQQLQIQKEKANTNIALLGIAFILLLGFGGFWLYRNKQNQANLKTQNTLLSLQQNLVEAELSSLNKQLDPHEIKNLLASISPEIQDKAPESYKKMLKLFNLTKASLNSNSITDSLENQLQQIDDFLSLEKNMLPIPLDYTIENSIQNTQTQIPRLLLKNLVENAIKHGIKPQETGGSIKVKVEEMNNFIYISVDDTGKGRNLAISLDSGIGTTTYQKLFATLNSKNKENATFEIIDKQQGTKVEVKIPTNYKYS